jgi:hypothetical protein
MSDIAYDCNMFYSGDAKSRANKALEKYKERTKNSPILNNIEVIKANLDAVYFVERKGN